MAENNPAEEMVSIAKIGRYRGNRGEVFIHPHFDLAAEALADVAIEIRWPKGKRFQQSRIERIWWQNKKAICKLQCSDSIEAARDLVHAEILVARHNLQPLEENQFFKSDLLGLDVQDTSGETLGKIEAIIDTKASSLLQLEGGKILIPMVPEIVLEIDLEQELITVDPPEGLLELNED